MCIACNEEENKHICFSDWLMIKVLPPLSSFSLPSKSCKTNTWQSWSRNMRTTSLIYLYIYISFFFFLRKKKEENEMQKKKRWKISLPLPWIEREYHHLQKEILGKGWMRGNTRHSWFSLELIFQFLSFSCLCSWKDLVHEIPFSFSIQLTLKLLPWVHNNSLGMKWHFFLSFSLL